MRFISALREAQDTKGRGKFKTMSGLAEPVAVEADLDLLTPDSPFDRFPGNREYRT